MATPAEIEINIICNNASNVNDKFSHDKKTSKFVLSNQSVIYQIN